MNKKIIIIVVLAGVLLIAAISAVLLINNKKDDLIVFNEVLIEDLNIKISGTIKNAADNEQITIIVYEKGKSPEDLSSVIYLDQTTVVKNDGNGNFEFSFTAPESARGKKYNIKAGSTSLDNPVIYDKVINIK